MGKRELKGRGQDAIKMRRGILVLQFCPQRLGDLLDTAGMGVQTYVWHMILLKPKNDVGGIFSLETLKSKSRAGGVKGPGTSAGLHI